MSYLLDALRRSERERRRTELPTVERARMELGERPEATASRWRFWLLGLLAANVLAAGWWWRAQPLGPPAPPAVRLPPPGPSVPAAPERRSVPAAPERRSVPAAPERRSVPSVPPAAPPPVAAPAPLPARSPASPRWPSLAELSAAERASWPPLEITAQVYSPTNVRARFVIVDGVFLREGDAMGDGTRVVEIAENAVLFERNGQRASAPVIDAPP